MTDGAVADLASDDLAADRLAADGSVAEDALRYDVVVPTLGRPSLRTLLASLARARGPLPDNVFVVDDRRERKRALSGAVDAQLGALGTRVRIVAGSGAGPAAARNRGWRRSRAPWIAFLDDDVVVETEWRANLQADLRACTDRDAGSQGRVDVPLPPDRPATDWERNVHALEDAQWITADCAYRREALRALDGFDERFPRAYREDADFALRLRATGHTIARGTRRIEHPVRAADPWISLRLQAGNADDALMDALHGNGWRKTAGAQRGAFALHARTAACGALAVAFAALWAASTARFAWQRIAPGPRDAREVGTMLATSVAIPFAAVYHRLRGSMRAMNLRAGRRVAPRNARIAYRLPDAVLFDRDGTLLVDEPNLRDPAGVTLVPGARAALDRLRDAAIAIGVVTNQPCIGDGRVSPDELAAVHGRLEELAGPFATIETCTHSPSDGCVCRKPAAGLVRTAAERLGVDPRDCIVVGDIGADVQAAKNAGARAILVPNAATLPDEVAAAPIVARDLTQAVERILAGRA